MSWDALVAIGRVVKPQGRRGEVVVEPFSDRPGRFPELRRAFVPAADGKGREVRVAGCWPHKGRYVLKLEGVDSIDDAEAFLIRNCLAFLKLTSTMESTSTMRKASRRE